MKSFFYFILLTLCSLSVAGQKRIILADLGKLGEQPVHNRTISIKKTDGDPYISLSQGKGEGIFWLPLKNFRNGTIIVEMRGKNVPQQSFIGLAFGGKNDSTFEAVYCRPFNFLSTDSVKRVHSIQYIAHPRYTWMLLREQYNGQFENEILSPPNPDDWFRMRIKINDTSVTAFINNESRPSLQIKRLTSSQNGKIGLFVGNNSGGDFRFIDIVNNRTR
ncbi:hypothetical protein [Lacibacter sp.]|uniref:hypothetical protein n=1 Tax=Lacibacter sp. TaxID=1915409 RepID=UPI002B4B417F|nr:hypothetical protein [Lacibacter sp.]HLP38973.1 hypothetical protein [Lacibacter sp.]